MVRMAGSRQQAAGAHGATVQSSLRPGPHKYRHAFADRIKIVALVFNARTRRYRSNSNGSILPCFKLAPWTSVAQVKVAVAEMRWCTEKKQSCKGRPPRMNGLAVMLTK